MIDSDRRLLLKSVSTDVNISNHGLILGYSQIGVLPKLSYLYYTIKFAIQNNCRDSFVFFNMFFPPFFNIINRGRIYSGGPRKSDIVINKAHDP